MDDTALDIDLTEACHTTSQETETYVSMSFRGTIAIAVIAVGIRFARVILAIAVRIGIGCTITIIVKNELADT